MDVTAAVWRGRRVLVTGHTGFKGSWLCLMLEHLGAEVAGFSLPPPTEPSLYADAAVGSTLDSVTGDIRDLAALTARVKETRPQVVFHLAAQPLVRASYAMPLETYATNVVGTANVLEACRGAPW